MARSGAVYTTTEKFPSLCAGCAAAYGALPDGQKAAGSQTIGRCA